MVEFVVQEACLPRQFQPLADKTISKELRGTVIRTPRGDVGEIRVAYQVAGGIQAFVRFPNATGWFPLSDLDPYVEEDQCPTGRITSSSTTPTELTAGLSGTSSTTSSSTTTTVMTSTEPSCACVSCVATLLLET